MTTWRERFDERFGSFSTNVNKKPLTSRELESFIDQELTAQREAILALGEGMQADDDTKVELPPICNADEREVAFIKVGYNAALDAYQRAIKDMEV